MNETLETGIWLSIAFSAPQLGGLVMIVGIGISDPKCSSTKVDITPYSMRGSYESEPNNKNGKFESCKWYRDLSLEEGCGYLPPEKKESCFKEVNKTYLGCVKVRGE